MTTATQTFQSILFADGSVEDERETPSFFADLNLDQLVATIMAGREEYRLAPFFHQPLDTVEAVCYRQEVFQELEHGPIGETVAEFAEQMRAMRSHLDQSQKIRHRLQKQAWFLDAVAIYCEAVTALLSHLTPLHLGSRGMLALREYLHEYVESDTFASLRQETEQLKTDLSALRYTIRIAGGRVTVGRYEGEDDYSAAVLSTFAKFKLGAAKNYLLKFFTLADVDPVEGQILDLVARLNPELFARLEEHFTRHHDFVEPTVIRFDREIHFYAAYLDLVQKCRTARLPFCYPEVSKTCKEVGALGMFDLALAAKRIADHGTVIGNDFELTGRERIIVVSGPNQGGKTTFARAFGQIHYLASLGCPVPGREARLFLCDHLFTHFEREEQLETLRGKLEDDLVRIYQTLETATPDSLVIMNEIFSSTALKDALFLGRKVMERLVALDLLCVCVTFVDELASFGPTTVSMMSTVDARDPTVRTYKIVRKPADGLAYALAIAEKYGLTYEALKLRVARGLRR